MAGPVCEVADAARRMDGVVCGPGAGLWPGEGCRAWLRACPAVAPEGAAVRRVMALVDDLGGAPVEEPPV